jgi:hypothetical protein
MEYYYFIKEREAYEKKLIDDKMGSGGRTNQINIPTILPESVTTKINKRISLEDLKEIKRRKREKRGLKK